MVALPPSRPAALCDARAGDKEASDGEPRQRVRDGMRIDWDVPIEMDDGLVLRADVFRPHRARASTR